MAGDKTKMAERRKAAVERSQQRSEEDRKSKAEKKREKDKLAVNEQIKVVINSLLCPCS